MKYIQMTELYSKNTPEINYSNVMLTIDWINCPESLQSIHYLNSKEFCKTKSLKLRPITDDVLHFHMQPPIPTGNKLQKRGGILFHEDMEIFKELTN
jgi:hypothetical protein